MLLVAAGLFHAVGKGFFCIVHVPPVDKTLEIRWRFAHRTLNPLGNCSFMAVDHLEERPELHAPEVRLDEFGHRCILCGSHQHQEMA
jgi:hypothetical protein